MSEPAGAAQTLDDTWRRTTAALVDLDDLDDMGWARPTRAGRWDVTALVLHLLLDAQRALVTVASPAAGPADVDAVTYWHAFRPGRDGADTHASYVVRAAAAHHGHAGLLAQWRDTSEAAGRAVRAADPQALVTTQGHVLRVGDLVSTLLVEATVHLLDLRLVAPPPAALTHTRGVLDGLLGEPLPADWDDTTAVLRATGREPSADPRLPLLA